MSLKLSFLYLLFICFIFSACEKLKPEIDQPAYLFIPDYKMEYKTAYSNGGPGTTNQKFTDVKLTANGKDLGIYPLPAKIPINELGSLSITIAPVIKVNGVSTVRAEYSPIKLFDTVITTKSGETHTIKPTFDYYPSGITFYWVEDFEVSGSSLIGDTLIKLQSDDKFEGAKAIKIELSGNRTSCKAYSSSPFPLPNKSEILYLEVNYKCNQKFEIGLLDQNGSFLGAAGGANPSKEWNKIYFFLTPVASRNQRNSYFIYFYLDNSNFTSKELGEKPVLYLDNIKVISQP